MADVKAAKALKAPGSLTELHTYVSYLKDKSGIRGWAEQQHLLQVRLFICLSLVITNLSCALIIFVFLQYCGENNSNMAIAKVELLVASSFSIHVL